MLNIAAAAACCLIFQKGAPKKKTVLEKFIEANIHLNFGVAKYEQAEEEEKKINTII